MYLKIDDQTLSGVLAVSLAEESAPTNRDFIVQARRQCGEFVERFDILLICVGGDQVRQQLLAGVLSDLFPVVAMENPDYGKVGASVYISIDPRFPEKKRLEGCGFVVPKSAESREEVCRQIEQGQKRWNDSFQSEHAA